MRGTADQHPGRAPHQGGRASAVLRQQGHVNAQFLQRLVFMVRATIAALPDCVPTTINSDSIDALPLSIKIQVYIKWYLNVII